MNGQTEVSFQGIRSSGCELSRICFGNRNLRYAGLRDGGSRWKEQMMIDLAKRLFVGIKISKALQNELDNPAPGTQHYFEGNEHNEYLQIINMGEQRIIGRYIKDGFPATEISEISRNVGGILKLITRGRRVEEKDMQIYSS
jgi:hypothetical protein